jgi:gas vesicle protein
MMKLKDIKELNKDKLLAMVGLEVAASITSKLLGATALVAAGALVGASVALLWTPKTGKELRREIRRRVRNSSEQVTDMLPDALQPESSGA